MYRNNDNNRMNFSNAGNNIMNFKNTNNKPNIKYNYSNKEPEANELNESKDED